MSDQGLVDAVNGMEHKSGLEKELVTAYDQLRMESDDVQRAFCVSCCERMYPNYAMHHNLTNSGSPRVLRGVMDILWQAKVKTLTTVAINVLDERTGFNKSHDSLLWSHLAFYARESVLLSLSLLNPDTRQDFNLQAVGLNAIQTVRDYVWWSMLPNMYILVGDHVSTPITVDDVELHLHCDLGQGVKVFTSEKIDAKTYNRWVATSPLVHREMAHQLLDIDDLLTQGATSRVLQKMRSRSSLSGIQPFHRNLITSPPADTSNDDLPF